LALLEDPNQRLQTQQPRSYEALVALLFQSRFTASMSAKIPAFSDIGKSTKGKSLSMHMLPYVSIAKISQALEAVNDR